MRRAFTAHLAHRISAKEVVFGAYGRRVPISFAQNVFLRINYVGTPTKVKNKLVNTFSSNYKNDSNTINYVMSTRAQRMSCDTDVRVQNERIFNRAFV